MRENFADQLVSAIRRKNSCVVVGLDPSFKLIPDTIKQKFSASQKQALEYASRVILEFNTQVIDLITPYVSIVKPQIAFYELYGWWGVWAYAETIQYARQKGLIVIGDVKRGDVPSTAEAYANAHIGEVHIDNIVEIPFAADAITVNPLLGTDSLIPFLQTARKHNKGIFILVKTSNPSSGEFQDIMCGTKKLHEIIAERTHAWGKDFIGKQGYSAVGAVVGATFSHEISKLRKIMPTAYFLVPGYGAQGATAKDIAHCFNPDGLGAIISASRSILYAYNISPWEKKYGISAWKDATQEAVIKMNEEIRKILK
ncbi:MAG: orotidine-5'-phosphate decarboxylase [Candidatus Brocadia sp. AMX2]|nr:MAG: orotidine-5'-phosphate decarboxylase [Candidatus Brocadia sp. AMX2]MBC6932522.1 orotidine-5'-phosphate decarboxylase [Candidatus Brocadia sp.]MCE7866969.1 orotidine-5'-phosphate decarboxylase [Candidatus Brocadia sp. AMX2]MCQ3917562.1 orotidine-5'-phosphate decarboxylase [Candidatus Brocadia sp.]MDL1936595.1 orotidine-5'-phosphate decarboxylase [Candidatus Brocadia sp. AMX2]